MWFLDNNQSNFWTFATVYFWTLCFSINTSGEVWAKNPSSIISSMCNASPYLAASIAFLKVCPGLSLRTGRVGRGRWRWSVCVRYCPPRSGISQYRQYVSLWIMGNKNISLCFKTYIFIMGLSSYLFIFCPFCIIPGRQFANFDFTIFYSSIISFFFFRH